MTWVLIVWCIGILVWAIAGGASAQHHSLQYCLSEGILTRQQCESAVDTGTGIGVALVLLIGFIGFVFFALIWFMTRPRGQRDCPACGETARRGQTVCTRCGFDFAAAAAGRIPAVPR